jgi:two-component system sensor histidine kinase PilS (NtrC family)
MAPLPQVEARESPRRRVLYLLAFRAAVTTLLLSTAVVAEVAAPTQEARPIAAALFAVSGAIYALTLAWALWLRRLAPGAPTGRLVRTQIACDLVAAALLTYLTGGADSALVLLFLLAVVGASTVTGARGTLVSASAASVLYLAVALGGRSGLLPAWPGTPSLEGAIAPILRTLAIHVVAIFATAQLASRLSRELQRAGERLIQQGALLEDFAALHADVVRSLTSGLITVDHDGNVQSINPAGSEILGVAIERASGQPIDRLLPGADAAVRAGDPLRRGEVTIQRPDGESRIVGLSASPLYSATGQEVGRVLSFQDLSELRRAQQQVERTARLAAIGRLAAGVAHEIRNPLAAISGSIQLLRAEAAGASGESGELWAIVTREVDRLDGLVADLLDFARQRPPDRAPLELGATLGEILRVLEGDQKLAGGRVKLDATPELWVEADPNQLRQVVWNLLRNAAEATPGDEAIEVTARAEREGDQSWARLEVRDHGAGIPERDRPRLFEPFFTTKKGGTGLGLATVHRIIEDHKGRLELGNADGGGARATVWLPRTTPDR